MLACSPYCQRRHNTISLQSLLWIVVPVFATWMPQIQPNKLPRPTSQADKSHVQVKRARALGKKMVMNGYQMRLIEWRTTSETDVLQTFLRHSWIHFSVIWTKYGVHVKRSKSRGLSPRQTVRYSIWDVRLLLRSLMLKWCTNRTSNGWRPSWRTHSRPCERT